MTDFLSNQTRLTACALIGWLAISACRLFALSALSPPTKTPSMSQVVSPAGTASRLKDANGSGNLLGADLAGFEDSVKEAVLDRDVDTIIQLLGDPFTITTWLSESVTLPSSEAASKLVDDYLLPQNTLLFVEGANPTTLVGVDPLRIWGPEVNTRSVLYAQGWGENGEEEALLILAQDPHSGFTWHSVLIAPQGFCRYPDHSSYPEIPFYYFCSSALKTVLQDTLSSHDYASLSEGLWTGIESTALWRPGDDQLSFIPTPSIPDLQTIYLPPGSQIWFDPDVSSIEQIGGRIGLQDLRSMWSMPGARLVDVLYSGGWGVDGKGEAALIFARTPLDENLIVVYWYGLLYAPEGFTGQAD